MNMTNLIKLSFILTLLVQTGCLPSNERVSEIIREREAALVRQDIKGVVNNGIYTSPNGEYSVAIPQYQDERQLKLINIKENHDDNIIYTSFGPSYTDKDIFRVSLIWKNDLSQFNNNERFKLDKEKLYDNAISQIEKSYKHKCDLILEKTLGKQDNNAYYRVYKQHFDEVRGRDYQISAPKDVFHLITIIDSKRYYLLFWTETEILLDPGIKKVIEEDKYPDHNKLTSSFKANI